MVRACRCGWCYGLVVHLKVTTVRGGKRTYRYLMLVESFREGGKVRHRVIARLGEASEMAASGELGRLVDSLAAQGGERAGGSLSAEAAPSVGAVAACWAVFQSLGLDRFFAALGAARRSGALVGAMFAMVANRLCEPSSKRRAIGEWLDDVVVPDGLAVPSLAQCYRALDALADAKDALEAHCYAAVCDLTNLDLRLVCYDLTSTYFETDTAGDARFPSKMFGYSRDHRGDRPQIMIGLLVTGDGIPIAHHVFAGNTNDATTLPTVLADLQHRFGVGRIAVVADRGLISETNLAAVAAAGFDHVIATRLHRDATVERILTKAAARPAADWTGVDDNTRVCDLLENGRRYVVVDSAERTRRDDTRTQQLLAGTATQLDALAERVNTGRLVDPAKIGAAAQRILGVSPVARCFATTIGPRQFAWDYHADALHYELNLLQGRYVISTSLPASSASATDVYTHYRALQGVERRFRVLKDFLALRPVYHWTEHRVAGHVALCVLAALIEAVIGRHLADAGIADPDLTEQTITPRRALRTLERVRAVQLAADDGTRRQVITKPDAHQAAILAALHVDTTAWTSRLTRLT